MTTFKKDKILIATGGTGGHVFPAYSLAKNLIKNNYDIEIVTDERGFKFLKKYKDLNLISEDKWGFSMLGNLKVFNNNNKNTWKIQPSKINTINIKKKIH